MLRNPDNTASKGAIQPDGTYVVSGVARGRVRNAGEMNGFLKPKASLLKNPLECERGAIALEPGYRPLLDPAALAGCTLERVSFDA